MNRVTRNFDNCLPTALALQFSDESNVEHQGGEADEMGSRDIEILMKESNHLNVTNLTNNKSIPDYQNKLSDNF